MNTNKKQILYNVDVGTLIFIEGMHGIYRVRAERTKVKRNDSDSFSEMIGVSPYDSNLLETVFVPSNIWIKIKK